MEDELEQTQKKLAAATAMVKELNEARDRMRMQKSELRMKVRRAKPRHLVGQRSHSAFASWSCLYTHARAQLLSMEQLATQNDERCRKAVDSLHAFTAGAKIEKQELLDQIKDKDVRTWCHSRRCVSLHAPP